MLLFCLTTVVSCKNSDFIEYQKIESSHLNSEQSVSFLMDGNLSFAGRSFLILYNTNSKLTTWQLPLMVQIVAPRGAIWSDTLMLDLSKEYSRVGKQYGELEIASNCDFTEDGVYKFKIKNLSKNEVIGIEELGVAIK